MSDFIFSTKSINKEIINKHFSEIYHKPISINYTETQYGILAFPNNHYNGFLSYETKNFSLIVIGGPILNFTNNNFINAKNSNEGTIAIYERWIENKKMVWDTDLSGPYVILYLNKVNGDLRIVSDMMSFIPCYHNPKNNDLILGTNIDIVSKINDNSFDTTSIAEFILSEIITFPYTAYKEIKQLNPGSIYHWNLELSNTLKEYRIYWQPYEPSSPEKIDYLSKKLKDGFEAYFHNFKQPNLKIGAFLSGGTDSRIIVSKLSEYLPIDTFIFVDNHNRESLVADKIADEIGTEHKLIQRSSNYYLDILKPACDLIGITSEYVHVHTYGLVNECKLEKYNGVFGGFLADTFLKGHHIKLKNIPKIFRFLPIPDKQSESNNVILNYSKLIENHVVDEVNSRRKKHRNRLKNLRPSSYNEWFNIWPITMHNDTANIHGNRRLFKNFEPFTASEIVKIAAKATQEQKLNNKLFLSAMREILEKTKNIPHANGTMPYYPWYINNIFKFIFNVKKKITFFKKQTNQGPWTDWEILLNSISKDTINENVVFLKKYLKHIFKNDFDFKIHRIKNDIEKRIIFQLGYHLSKKEKI